MAQCTAKSKTTGKRCKKQAVPGKKVCRYHGGASKSGALAGAARSLRYSKVIPSRMLERYLEAERDPQLLSLRADIALVDARIGELLKRTDHGGAAILWDALNRAFNEYMAFRRAGKVDEMSHALEEVGEIVKKGHVDSLVWNEIMTLMALKMRLAESERKRLVEMQQILTMGEASSLVTTILDVVKRTVSNPDEIVEIGKALKKMLGEIDPNGEVQVYDPQGEIVDVLPKDVHDEKQEGEHD